MPFLVGGYLLALLLSILMYVTLSQSWNIISGFTGYISFGHSVFFGIGSYTTALAILNWNVPPFCAPILGGIMAVLIGLCIGYPTLRLRGPYFAITTLVICEVFRTLAENLTWLTNGSRGLVLPAVYSLIPSYYMALITAIGVNVGVYRLAHSKFGLALKAIQDNEEVACTVGINTGRFKLIAFLLSSFPIGVIGGIMAYYWTYIAPSVVFNVILSTYMLTMCLVGGRGTVLGPIVGATILTVVLSELAVFPYIHAIIFGIILIAVILVTPGGIMELIRRLFKR
jgi:branched-chain amino acid transport system permease protein